MFKRALFPYTIAFLTRVRKYRENRNVPHTPAVSPQAITGFQRNFERNSW